jgi:HK97 family phage portal protein
MTTGLFDKLFHRQPKDSRPASSLSGYMPIFSQMGTNVYAFDAVRQAIKRIVDELVKLNPTHVRNIGSDSIPVKSSSVQRVLDNPNPLMTTSDFLEKIAWLLMLNCNAFILPVYKTWTEDGDERREYQALYPIRPAQVDFIEDLSGRLFVKFYFLDGSNTTIPYDNVIHIRTQYSINDYMGGNEMGMPDNIALMKTVQLNEQLLQGVAKSMNASYAVNGVLKYNSYLDDGILQENLKNFERKLSKSESGILPIDMKSEFTPLERRTHSVDESTLKFIDEKILRTYGVSLAILNGDYTKEQYEAFYSQAIEPLVIKLTQGFTKKMFTSRERAFGNEVNFYTEELTFMTITQRLELINTLAPQGGGYVNEYRRWLGLRPLEELEGKRFMSLNWIDADKAALYQTGKENIDIVDEEKEDI